MIRGSAIHEGLAKIHLSLDESMGAADSYIRENYGLPSGIDPVTEERCIVVSEMVRASRDKWGTTDWPIRKEVPFQVPIVNPKSGYRSRKYDFAGVMDGAPDLVERTAARKWYSAVGEWKSSSRINSDYFLSWETKKQPTAYCHAASIETGRKIRNTIVRVVGMPTIRRRTKRNPETLADYRARLRDYYGERSDEMLVEFVVHRTDEQIEEWQYTLHEMTKRDARMRKDALSSFPMMNENACIGNFGRCEYLDLCGRSVDAGAYEQISDLHPEVTAAVTESEGRK